MGRKIGPGAVLIFDIELLSVVDGKGTILPDWWEVDRLPYPIEAFLHAVLLPPVRVPGYGKRVGPLRTWHALFFCGIAIVWFLTSGRGKTVTASHILVDDAHHAKRLYDDLSKAKDLKSAFAAAASEHSRCPSSCDGGDLGDFGADERPATRFPTTFFEECWNAQTGALLGPLQSHHGYHLILVTKKTGSVDLAAGNTAGKRFGKAAAKKTRKSE